MADSPLGGFAEGLQGGLAAGSRLNANAIQERDSGIKSILSARNLQIEEAKNAQGVKSKEQDKAIKVREDIVGAIKTAYAEGDPGKIAAANKQIDMMLAPIDAGNGLALSPVDVLDQNAGLAKGTTAQQLKIIQSVQPGIADKGYGAQVSAQGTQTGTNLANIAQAPTLNKISADKAAGDAAATVTGRTTAETALRPQIAANAGAVSGAQTGATVAATPSPIVRLQGERAAAIARGDTRGASEIDQQITALGSSQTYDPRAATVIPASEIRKAANDLSDGVSARAGILKAKDLFADAPGAAGLLGKVKESLSGYAAQFATLTGMANYFPNDPAVVKARTQLRQVAKDNLMGAVSSGRLSNDQVRRGEEMYKGLTDSASDQQVQEALQMALDFADQVNLKNANKLLGNVELTSEKGVTDALNILTKNGLGQKDAIDFIARVRMQRQ